MSPMPKSVRPVDPAWSDDLDSAAIAYGTPVRMQIMRHLRVVGPSMRYQLEQATGIKHALLVQSLNKLEATGVVTVNLPPEERSTRALTYSLDRKRADYLLDLMTTYVRARGS
jgi:DNA-binding HxlR family transcriptional regulator